MKNAPDESFVGRAVQTANLNALRVALYHETGDPRLAEMEVQLVPVRSGAFVANVVARHHHDELRELAVSYLLRRERPRPHPSREEAAELMRLFTGQPMTDAEFAYGYEDLAFEEHPHDVQWSNGRPDVKLRNFTVTVVGAGISGIAAAVLLERLGIAYRIVERMGGIGGTWHLNDYPEARVDITSFLYQYRFVKNYPWRSFFATQEEVKEYLDFVIDSYGIRPNIDLNTTLTSARWDDARARWVLGTSGPRGEEVVETKAVISCSGLFSTPNLPDIPGIETFSGAMFHTTAWDHGYDWSGRRVALIGTGSTGAQLMPALARYASHLSVFQRTPNWVTPVPDYHAELTTEQRWLLDTMPGYWNWHVYSTLVAGTQTQHLQEIDAAWVAGGGRVNHRNGLLEQELTAYMHRKMADRQDLVAKLLPNYAPLARRLVVDNGWYDALLRDNVELVTESIERVTPTGMRTVDGIERDFDLIVLGAGFKVSKYLWPVPYLGRDGTTLEELWAHDGARAHLAITLPGFPNFFMFYGPNSQARGGGFHSWAEIVARYVCSLIVAMVEADADSVEVRREVYDDYNARMDEAMTGILWEKEGQGGYYTNEHGRAGVNMPWRTDVYFEMVRRPDLNEFELRSRVGVKGAM